MYRFVAKAFLACALIAPPSPTDGGREPVPQVGLVLKVKGNWLLNGKSVDPGEALPAGGKIYHAPQKDSEPFPFDHITVVLYDGKLESRSWDKPESWKVPIQLPAGKAPSHWTRVVTAVMDIFPGHPEK